MEIGTKNHRKSEQPNPPWRSEQPTTKNHRGGASRPLGSSLLPWRLNNEKPPEIWRKNNQKPPWSVLHGVASVVTDLSREPRCGSVPVVAAAVEIWTTKHHRKSEERTTKNHRGPCFTAWPRWLQIWAESHAMGLSWWWLVVSGGGWLLRKEKKKFWRVGFFGKFFCWWFRNVLAYLFNFFSFFFFLFFGDQKFLIKIAFYFWVLAKCF